jgi:hypothetical protein
LPARTRLRLPNVPIPKAISPASPLITDTSSGETPCASAAIWAKTVW